MTLRTLVLLLAAGMPGWALAQADAGDAPQNPQQSPQQNLYQDALQSLSEGRRGDASDALSRLIEREPQHAGAWLDLGLIQCSLGHADEAERLFATVETRFTPSRDILELIAQARETGCRKSRPSSALNVSVGRGIDNNVNQGASNATFVVTGPDGQIELPLLDEFLPRGDQYTSLTADYVRDISDNGSLGFVQFQQRHYDRMHRYDTGGLYAGIESPFRFGAWALRLTGSLGVGTMGGRLYQKQAQAQARVTPPLPLPANTQLHVTGAVTHTEYATLQTFNSDTYELRTLLSRQRGTLSTNVAFGLLSDRARDDRPGGNRHGRFVTLSLHKPFAWNLVGDASYTAQRWNSAAPYAPELLIDQVRAQRTDVLRASLTYQMGKYQSVVLEGRAVHNRENISIFQYNNRQLQLSWQWRYP